PELSVQLALLWIAEDVVRLGDLFEALFGSLVPRVDVGVVLASPLTVALLDLGVPPRPRPPGGGVQILLRHPAALGLQCPDSQFGSATGAHASPRGAKG